ncbi:MAG: HEAT repeat domain-containing protein [Deltaproteobacteria bacterium]|nr:HEAT repeat domain-containing protein [Deltaproteobacteria bacterium]
MKTYARIGKTAGLVLLIFFLAGLLATANDFSDKKTVAADRTKTEEERIGAIYDLGAWADTSAVAVLLKILQDRSEDSRIRRSAVTALAALGAPRAQIINAFRIAYHESDGGKNLRYTILYSLGEMKAVEAINLLSTALSSDDNMIRLKSAQALGTLQSEDALLLLAAHLTKEGDYMVRAAAVRAVGQSKTAFAENILVTYLRSDPSPLVRNNAAIMLGTFFPWQSSTKAALQAALADESETVRETVRRILP